jgi:hypothetical protein
MKGFHSNKRIFDMNSLTNIPIPVNRFQIERIGDRYTMIVNTGERHELRRYRNKRSGAKKYDVRLEPVAGTGYERVALTKEQMQALTPALFGRWEDTSYYDEEKRHRVIFFGPLANEEVKLC